MRTTTAAVAAAALVATLSRAQTPLLNVTGIGTAEGNPFPVRLTT